MNTALLMEDWKIEFHSGIPVYKQIANRLMAAMADGTLKHGDRLPTIRELHERLGVNPNTVAKAYHELTLKGLLDGQRGFGSFVKLDDAANALPAAKKKAKLKELYQRMLAEARGYGLDEEQILSFIKQRKTV
ncbi:MAG TPA: GntR family transcriptional regulator [Verrucomicrobiae bacterium]|jgi:GntR family transcriptional regulator|nr:GntR family transcriptional regulator [Verrucomicrobiae bacterium]